MRIGGDGIKTKAICIPSIDAKDLYLSNHYNTPQEGGYRLRNQNGEYRLSRFSNTLDYSLDLIKLREVYERVYRNTRFTFERGGKEYSNRVINVTFKYSDKVFNRASPGLYIKSGWAPEHIELKDCIAVVNGELVAVQTGAPVETPAKLELLKPCFFFEDGVYHVKDNIKALRSVRELRENLYINGFDCDGIHYVRWKRSNGSARIGKCLFIDAQLYRGMHQWETCGISVKHGDQIDLAAFESYISLTSSSIIDTREICPENILVIDDYTSVFREDAATTYIEDGKLETRNENAEICNSIWDGQSLIDADLTEKYHAFGMVLMRNRFFKSCCFRTRIQDWFSDRNITSVSQLNGHTLAKSISEIKLITTPSSIKYLKFGTLEKWLELLDPIFGIVKHDKPTHYFDGAMVKTHYQLLNTLHLGKGDMEALLSPSLRFLDALRSNPAVLRYFIKYPDEPFTLSSPLLSKNEIVYKLLGINENFSRTKLYTDFRYDLVKAFLKELRFGRVLVHGAYCTLCGNPVEMLEQCIGAFRGESRLGIGNIHTQKFEYGQKLVGSRSPHVTIGNVWVPVNVDSEEIERYFAFSKEIVVINSIGENVLMRLSGAD